MKIRTMGAELFHVDGGTYGRKDKTKLIVNYRNFANAPKIVIFFHLCLVLPTALFGFIFVVYLPTHGRKFSVPVQKIHNVCGEKL